MAEIEELVVSSGTVLVVDDDPDMLNLLSTWLESAGFEATAVASGNEAVRELQVARPDIVVTDLFMDEMDGMTLVTRVHQDNPLTPVIMLSGQAQIPDAVQATHLGFSHQADREGSVSRRGKPTHQAEAA